MLFHACMDHTEFVEADFLMLDALPVTNPCWFPSNIIFPQPDVFRGRFGYREHYLHHNNTIFFHFFQLPFTKSTHKRKWKETNIRNVYEKQQYPCWKMDWSNILALTINLVASCNNSYKYLLFLFTQKIANSTM